MQELKHTDLLPNFLGIELNDSEKSTQVTYASFQERAHNAIEELAYTSKSNPIMLLTTSSDINIEDCIKDLISNTSMPKRTLYDICYAENLTNPLAPTWLHIKSGTATEFNTLICELLNKIQHKLDAEDVLLRILHKQDNNKKLEDYLSDLAIHIAEGKDFAHPVLMNLMVCHEPNQVPVIFGQDLTWKRLFGGVNYLTENGTTYSHQHLLEAGVLRKADGGFLILPVDELVRNPLLWFKLKNTLKAGLLDWENPTENPTSLVPFFAPEPTPINVRIILVGSYLNIAELYNYDPEIQSAIYLRTDLTSYFNLQKYGKSFLQYLYTLANKLKLLPFSDESMLRLVRESCRYAESQTEFLINEQKITAIMLEANGKAQRAKKDIIDLEIMTKTLLDHNFRSNSVVDESSEFYHNKQMLISTDGDIVGQINGLSVIQTFGSDFEYGEPVRITATIHSGGEGDIADIEHKADLAGQIHTKAMMIINGYLTNKFASIDPLPVSANLVFEQSYSEIDGDSASLTGLCAILSALSKQPIKQSFSVTGAVDQLGNVQPVGGVNEKIEGFYRICRIQGLTGKQGVIIPKSNIQSLILNDEIIEAVSNGMFHIYAVSSVDEAIELLTGVKANLASSNQENPNQPQALNNEVMKEQTPDIYTLILEQLDKINERTSYQKQESLLSTIKKFFTKKA